MTGRIVHFQLSASSSAIYKSSSPPHVSVPNQLERSEHIYRYIYRYKYIYKYESKTNTYTDIDNISNSDSAISKSSLMRDLNSLQTI